MSTYLLIEGTIQDQQRWTAYRKAVVPLIERFGGRHLTGSGAPELLEGTQADRIVALFRFPSADSLRAFWESPDYVPVKALRQGAATLDIRSVPGAD